MHGPKGEQSVESFRAAAHTQRSAKLLETLDRFESAGLAPDRVFWEDHHTDESAGSLTWNQTSKTDTRVLFFSVYALGQSIMVVFRVLQVCRPTEDQVAQILRITEQR